MFSCIGAAYKVGSHGLPSVFDMNDMTDEIGSILRTKKNLMNR